MNASARTATVTWRDDGSTSELSVYQLQLHPDFAFAIGDVVLKLPPPAGAATQDGAAGGAGVAASEAAVGAADPTTDNRETAVGAGSGAASASAAAGGAEGEGASEQVAKAPGKGPAAVAGRGAPMLSFRIISRRCLPARSNLDQIQEGLLEFISNVRGCQ